MIKKNKGTLILTSIVILLPIIIGLLLWNQLPEQIPSHWNIDGEVDGWSSKPWAVFGFPSLLFAIHWICVLASTTDPKRANYYPKAFQLVLWICPGLGLLLNSLVYATALGHEVDVQIILPLTVGLLFLIVGNMTPKMRQTYTMGIKLPWTLANEENWNKTHRFAGKVWVIGGVIVMATAFVGCFWILLGVLIVMVALPTIYSYRHYLKYEKGTAD